MNAPGAYKGSTPFNRFAARHPYLTTLILLLVLVAVLLLVPRIIDVVRLPGLTRAVIGEVLAALVVAVLITLFNWWRDTGFASGINEQGILLCIIPIILIAWPVLFALPFVVKQASAMLVVTAVILSLLVGFVEEGFFRGLILRVLLPKGIGLAVILSSLLFALVHLFNLFSGFTWQYIAGQFLLALGLGLLFAALRLRTGSIWPTVLLHAIRDVGGLILLGTNPNMVLSVPLNQAVIVNGVFCVLFMINAAYLLRPSQIKKLHDNFERSDFSKSDVPGYGGAQPPFGSPPGYSGALPPDGHL